MTGRRLVSIAHHLTFHRARRSNWIREYATHGSKNEATGGLKETPAVLHTGTPVTTRLAEDITNPAMSPNLYKSGNSFQREANLRALKKFGNNVEKVANTQLRYLDIGCATGDFTREVLLTLSNPAPIIVAVDISSEMIDYAKRHSHHPNISYDVLDIGTRCIAGFVSKYEQFDRVYSFYCLQWVKNKATALRNIATLMKSGGDCQLLFPVQSPLYTVWRDIAKLPRWKVYTKDFETFIPTTEDLGSLNDVSNHVTTAVQEAGLVLDTCEIFKGHWDFDTKEDMMDNIMPLIPVLSSEITEEQREDFYKDLFNILSKSMSKGSSKFLLDIDLCALRAHK